MQNARICAKSDQHPPSERAVTSGSPASCVGTCLYAFFMMFTDLSISEQESLDVMALGQWVCGFLLGGLRDARGSGNRHQPSERGRVSTRGFAPGLAMSSSSVMPSRLGPEPAFAPGPGNTGLAV